MKDVQGRTEGRVFCSSQPFIRKNREGQLMRFSGPLKENYMFRRLYNRGTSAANSHLVLYVRRNGLGKNRVGITVSGKLGKAVERNLIRRRLREIYRVNEDCFAPGWDLVVVARTRAMTAEFSKLQRAYLSLAGKLNILKQEESNNG